MQRLLNQLRLSKVRLFISGFQLSAVTEDPNHAAEPRGIHDDDENL